MSTRADTDSTRTTEPEDAAEHPSEAWEHLEVGFDEAGIGHVVVNRPKVLNALNTEVLDELAEAVEVLAGLDEVRVIVLSGAGEKAFVAGADITEMADFDPLAARDFSQLGQATLDMIDCCPKPVIAMIRGYALGGGLELAMACHLRVAARGSKLGLPEVGLGLLPGFGGTQRLARLAGAGIARQWILTGDPVDAEEAHRVGVVNLLADADKLEETTRELALKIASRGPVALQLALESVRRGLDEGPTAGMAAESDAFGLVFSTEDMREGTKAFLEKRKPDFQGR